MKKRIMVVGPVQSGKSTLINALNDCILPLKKTQDVIYGRSTIDTPGAYLENPGMYRYLIALAQDASCVLILVDQSRPVQVYPPGFAKVFNCPVVGVITKIDLAVQNAPRAREQLKRAGVFEPYFAISLPDNLGMADLKDYLFGLPETTAKK
ncbi:MAG: EutP/PduV family microcompartment system protein [Peptococcaceae bacterium]